MQHLRKTLMMSGALGLMTMLGAAPALEAQNRLVLPRGSVILVRTTTALQSSNARVGQTFETNVLDSVRINGYTVIPAGSRITSLQPNHPNNSPGSFFSSHTGGAQFLNMDGSCRFISSSVSIENYRALCSRDGGEIVTAN